MISLDKEINQENLFVDIMNLDKFVKSVCDIFQHDLQKGLEEGNITREDVEGLIPTTAKSFDDFISYLESLKTRSVKLLGYLAVDHAKQSEICAKNALDDINIQLIQLSEKVNVAKKHLDDVCTHTDTEIVEDYVEGGYLDRFQYIKRKVCNTCGKELDKHVTQGGFG